MVHASTAAGVVGILRWLRTGTAYSYILVNAAVGTGYGAILDQVAAVIHARGGSPASQAAGIAGPTAGHLAIATVDVDRIGLKVEYVAARALGRVVIFHTFHALSRDIMV